MIFLTVSGMLCITYVMQISRLLNMMNKRLKLSEALWGK